MVYFILANGFEEVEALAPADILMRGGIAVKFLSLSKDTRVTGTHGITMTAGAPLGNLLPDDAEMLVFPGGMPGAANIDADPRITGICDSMIAAKKPIGAICAAPMILGRRGYLAGKKATCFPGFEKDLKDAAVTHTATVTDGLFTTGIGMGAAYAFGLALLTVLRGKETALHVREKALMPPLDF